MLKIYDLKEFTTEHEIDEYIEVYGNIPICHYVPICINTVVEESSNEGTFYLAENDECVWWFGPRNNGGIAGQYDYNGSVLRRKTANAISLKRQTSRMPGRRWIRFCSGSRKAARPTDLY